MMKQNQTALTASAGLGLKKKLGMAFGLAMLGLSQQALAHVHYYDLNQGAQILDLTTAGVTEAANQYGVGPSYAANPSQGIGAIKSLVHLPLNNPNYWNSTYQSYVPGNSGATFTNATSATTGLGSATVDIADGIGNSWVKGTTPTLGDTHAVNWFNFRLAQASTVTISWNLDDGFGGYFDNGFSVYKGFLTFEGHDAGADGLNPRQAGVKRQNVLDGPTAPVDVQGIASAFRNTGVGAPEYVGQFNALANWGVSTTDGFWSNVAFVASQNANNPVGGYGTTAADTLETVTLSLPAGNYTIGAGGAVLADPSASLHGQLTFTAAAVAAVPLPGAVWLFMTAMFGFLGLNRRKSLAI